MIFSISFIFTTFWFLNTFFSKIFKTCPKLHFALLFCFLGSHIFLKILYFSLSLHFLVLGIQPFFFSSYLSFILQAFSQDFVLLLYFWNGLQLFLFILSHFPCIFLEPLGHSFIHLLCNSSNLSFNLQFLTHFLVFLSYFKFTSHFFSQFFFGYYNLHYFYIFFHILLSLNYIFLKICIHLYIY